MTILNHWIPRAFVPRTLHLLACAALLSLSSAQAAFTILDLGTLPTGGFYVSTALDHFPDGRLLYGTRNSLYQQDIFGAAPTSAFTAPASWDPASIEIYDNTHGVVAAGSDTKLYRFNPSDLSTAFTAVPDVDLQNFSVAYRDASTLLVSGANGTGGKASISVVATDGSLNKVIIDNAGAYSGALTFDVSGNLFVTNAEAHLLYKFTPAQIQAAITGTVLNLSDYAPLTALRRTGSLAIDAQGRIISGGYAADASFQEIPGFDIYDPATGEVITLTPAGANADYVVSTFSDADGSYIGFLDANYQPGSSVRYGYDRVENVPEPAQALLLLAGGVLLFHRRFSRG